MKDWEELLAASLRARWKRYRAALAKCRRHFTEGAVHGSRVETRRMMSQLELLGLFAPRPALSKAQRVLDRHMDAFDELRDTQVQLLLLRRHARELPNLDPLHHALLRREQRCLKQARRDIDGLKTGRLKKLVSGLTERLGAGERPSGRLARDRRALLTAVERAFHRAVQRRQRIDPGDVASVHRMRVDFKRFRYMVEALQPLFPGITRRRLEAMHTFQGLMGDLQDTDVFLARVDKFGRRDPRRARALAGFRYWLLRHRTAQMAVCVKRADDLMKFWPLPGSKRLAQSSDLRPARRPPRLPAGSR